MEESETILSPHSESVSTTSQFTAEQSTPLLHDNISIRLQKVDGEQQEIKQTAVNALHQNSILAMHVIASGEVD